MTVVFTEDMAAAVCARVAAGESLRALATAPGMPHRTTVRGWVQRDPVFAASLAAAMRTARSARRVADRAVAQARRARPAPVKGGKPSSYSPQMGAVICERLSNGESLVGIARDADMPAAGTVYGWVKRHPEFEEMYVQARQLQADYLFDEAREVALAATKGNVWVSRLRFDVIRWQTARLAPRKYCERLVVRGEVEAAEPKEEPLTVHVRTYRFGEDGKVEAYPPFTPEQQAEIDAAEVRRLEARDGFARGGMGARGGVTRGDGEEQAGT